MKQNVKNNEMSMESIEQKSVDVKTQTSKEGKSQKGSTKTVLPITSVEEEEEMAKTKSIEDSNETIIQESGTEKVKTTTVLKEEEEMAKTQSIEDSNETTIQKSGTEKVQPATALKEKKEMGKNNKKKSSKSSNCQENNVAEVQTDYFSQICKKHSGLKPILEEIEREMKALYHLNPDLVLDDLPVSEYIISIEEFARQIIRRLQRNKLGTAFRISEVVRNDDTGVYSLVLELYTFDGIRRLEEVPTSISTRKLEEILCDNGCIVQDAKATHRYFKEKMTSVTLRLANQPEKVFDEDGEIRKPVWDAILGDSPILSIVHSKCIGWDIDKISGQLVFKGKYIYTSDDTYSDYKGDFMIGEEGDYEIYLDMLKEEVIGHIPLETALAFAASATLLEFMNRMFALSLLNPIVHLYSDSTTGKTTAFKLMISFGGKPVNSENPSMEALLTTFNGTENSLLKVIGNNNGFPAGLDELGMNGMTKKEQERVLYALTGGQDKKRLLRDGSGLQKGVSFATTIMTNGEESIKPHNSVKQGLLNRVFEFACITWTKSAENAKKIQMVCENNYGFVTPMLARYLLRLDEAQRNQLLNSYQEWKQKFIDRAKIELVYDKYTERLSETLALFMISLECFGKVTMLKLHYKEVFEFLFDNIIIKEADNANLGIRAYQHLLSVYNNESDAFWDFRISPSVGSGKVFLGSMVEGKKTKIIDIAGYDKFPSTRRIGLSKEQAEEIFIKRGKFSDVKVIMKELNKMGVLFPGGDRTTGEEFAFGKIMVKGGYQIQIPDDICIDFDEDEDGYPIPKRC